MKLKQLKLSNFRCYKDETIVDLDDLVVLVGRNDAGKSSLFDALDIFFENKSAPDKEDLCVYAESSVVRISCVFTDVPSQVVIDAQHTTELANEFLLNEDGNLEIIKEYNCSILKPKLSTVYAKALHPTLDKFDDLLLLTNTELKRRARELAVDCTDVNQTVNSELRSALWSHPSDLQMREIELELLKGDASKIWSQLKKTLPVFALFKSDRPSTDQDAEAQDPMKAAVKEAISVQKDRLDVITEQVKVELQEIANQTVEKIAEMDPELASQLTPRVTHKNWDTLFSVNLTGDEDIPINKRGSGTRRLVLLNFFRAKAEKVAGDGERGLIYSIEEPETSQHPNNQVLLVKALQELVDFQECQVFVSTHTPVLARRFDRNNLRLVDKRGSNSVIRLGSENDTIETIVESLGVLPDHNIRAFVGVEGKHDISFLMEISNILHSAEENVPDLTDEQEKGKLVFVPLGGSNIDLWVSRLRELNRPEFYLMDRDYPEPCLPRYHEIARRLADYDNCKAWTTSRKELENYIHPDVIRSEYSNYTGTGDAFEDVPELLAKAIHEASASEDTWEEVRSNEKKLKKKKSTAKHRLNSELVSKMNPSQLSSIDTKDEIRSWLKEIGDVLR